MNIQSHTQVSPRSPAGARSSGKAGSARPMEPGLLDRFCQPLTLAELEAASLTAQTRLVMDSLSDLIRAYQAEGLQPAGLMLTLQQLRRDVSGGHTAPVIGRGMPGTAT